MHARKIAGSGLGLIASLIAACGSGGDSAPPATALGGAGETAPAPAPASGPAPPASVVPLPAPVPDAPAVPGLAAAAPLETQSFLLAPVPLPAGAAPLENRRFAVTLRRRDAVDLYSLSQPEALVATEACTYIGLFEPATLSADAIVFANGVDACRVTGIFARTEVPPGTWRATVSMAGMDWIRIADLGYASAPLCVRSVADVEANIDWRGTTGSVAWNGDGCRIDGIFLRVSLPLGLAQYPVPPTVTTSVPTPAPAPAPAPALPPAAVPAAAFSLASVAGRNTEPIAYGGVTRETRPVVALTLQRPLQPGESVTVLLDGAVVRALASGSSLSYEERKLDEGTHVYRALFTDAAGRRTTLDLNGATPGTDFGVRVR